MRRFLAVLAVVLVASAIAGCGNEAKPAAAKNTGQDPRQNAATATHFFQAVASNDPDKLTSALELTAPSSPARSYLDLVQHGLDVPRPPDTLTVDGGRYKICKADLPSCHTYAAVVLSDGKVDDFTVDGKRIRLR